MRIRPGIALGILVIAVSACSGRGALPPEGVVNVSSSTLADAASQPCTVSYDGFIWYSVPNGSFGPVQQKHSTCPRTALSLNAKPPIPAWAQPGGSTQAIFVATSLQENYGAGGMETLETIAAAHHVPMSWMIAGGSAYLTNSIQAATYSAYHASNGDDVEGEQGEVASLQFYFPWYVPSVSAEVGGRGHDNRNPALALSLNERGFWGITWNSHGTDGIEDYGAPWGTYCADPSSYKRPTADGSCALVSFEWTARDLTRAYLSGEEASFSTDPDDLLRRGGFSTSDAQTYIAHIVDAYAAAGTSHPLVMVSQQETAEALNAGDGPVMDALYARAVADGMKIETLRQAVTDAVAFSAQPRAVAFPFITGGKNAPSALLGGTTVYPATIDYHDRISGMTFIAGETLPTRVFRYADYPTALDALPMPQVPASQLPALTNVAVSGGKIALHFDAPVSLHYGIALWTDPGALGLSGAGVVPAGHAGVVLVFDLQSGPNDVSFVCANCTGTTFPYST